jgi:peptidoglycan hydrolase-like amidase
VKRKCIQFILLFILIFLIQNNTIALDNDRIYIESNYSGYPTTITVVDRYTEVRGKLVEIRGNTIVSLSSYINGVVNIEMYKRFGSTISKQALKAQAIRKGVRSRVES